ncbi:Glycosyl transferase, family 1 protein [Actinidia chinensis var. chinensis]|uniref:Glycosyl transferase, family 1 protein n=1 Tax=Actinidia chinensis var. chinensis TaxID=1590841 RepID=A0A2R6Q7U5_ACTCC|nr:Glycosyl transferase, family 1 protein [Actinidia chinensis var. chinensis]
MGSLESGVPLKRDQHLLRSSSATNRNERNPYGQRPRSRFARLVLFKKIDYLQWICTIAVFFFFVGLFQMLLPGSVMEKSDNSWRGRGEASGDSKFWKEIGGGFLDFGEDIKFVKTNLLSKFQRESNEVNMSSDSRRVVRFGHRKPQLALVFADLLVDPQQILMVTVAAALREIGYEIEVYSLEDGPVLSIWKNLGVPVTVIQASKKDVGVDWISYDGIIVNSIEARDVFSRLEDSPVLSIWKNLGVPVTIIQASKKDIGVDWISYDGIIVNSIEARDVFSRLLQEPFKSVPVIWSIHERTRATRLRQYALNGQLELVNDWNFFFKRSTVVVFPNYALPMFYAACDSGNYFVIPGSPAEAWEAGNFMVSYKDKPHVNMDYGPDDFVVVIVGSQLLYRGFWLEHAFVLKALLPLFEDFSSDKNSNSHLKIIILSGDSTTNYSVAVEAIAINLSYPRNIVSHAVDEDADNVLSMADLVIYGSFLEEQSFPDILMKAMCFGKPIIAPDLAMIKKYADDRVNGYLFPKENIRVLTQTILEVVSNGKLSPLARNIASIGKRTAKNLLVLEAIEGYTSLVENVLKLPSEVKTSKAVAEIPSKLKEEWQWQLFESVSDSTYLNRTLRSHKFFEEIEKTWNRTQTQSYGAVDETFLYSIWEEENLIEMSNTRKRREEELLKDRTDQPRGTWEDVYRSAKRADRSKNELREREDRELERTGQPLCIYEPYFGEGTWPFLHHTSLYRGLGLSTRGRRPGSDDIDAPSRLPLLNNPYYRDALGEYGAFFAIATRIDRIHKNAWIGFQSWRATARKESLSKAAETALLDAIQLRRNGDTLYFWIRMDKDPRSPLQQDFWSFCDAINAGNCKFAFSEALKRMYGIKHDWTSLPPMPADGDTWSVMQSWVLPTKSFLEFVMFSRIFVDALDAEFYDKHHQSGHCHLSLSKDKHCYSRVLELLVNVWAYHSARKMVYVNPETGAMQEQHKLKNRRGQMWAKWFSYTTLKNMDEDLAEEYDSDHPRRRWLWPSTGEVFWQGMYEKERNLRNREKERRKQESKDKIERIKRRQHQKPIGKFVKPPPEAAEDSNSKYVVARLLR